MEHRTDSFNFNIQKHERANQSQNWRHYLKNSFNQALGQ
nr:MAG TPA: hypothetical protein [Caudoviricetes sp.]